MRCSKCRAEIPDDAVRCPKCGSLVVGKKTSANEAASLRQKNGGNPAEGKKDSSSRNPLADHHPVGTFQFDKSGSTRLSYVSGDKVPHKTKSDFTMNEGKLPKKKTNQRLVALVVAAVFVLVLVVAATVRSTQTKKKAETVSTVSASSVSGVTGSQNDVFPTGHVTADQTTTAAAAQSTAGGLQPNTQYFTSSHTQTVPSIVAPDTTTVPSTTTSSTTNYWSGRTTSSGTLPPIVSQK